MTGRDAVRDMLRARGCPEHVVTGGLEGLIHRWESVVEDVEETYPLGLDDYLDDMDARQLLEEAMAAASAAARKSVAARVSAADARMRGLLVPQPRCLWGDAEARQNGWTPEENWWYFHRPADPGPDLAEDLEKRG